MISRIIIFFINLLRGLGNLWRRLWRRRVDYVRVILSGPLPEFADPPRWVQRRFLGARTPLSILALRRMLERIAADPQAQGILLKIDGPVAGWATLQSLRDELSHFRASGKRVVVYLLTTDIASYYTACAADTIIMPPTAFMNILGLRSEIQFLRDTLAKYGIEVEATAVSPYKSAPDTFVRTDFSPESREQFERLLDQRFAEFVRAVSAGRNKTIGEIHNLVDSAPIPPGTALEHGLVDALCYEDELEPFLTAQKPEKAADKIIILDWPQAQRALRLLPARYSPKFIGLIQVQGTIMRGGSQQFPLPLPFIGGATAGSESLAQALRQAEQNKRVAAIVLYVNSPGGEVFASDLMWREVLRVRRQKPVVVAMGNAAASGGYYIAAPASAIIAQPGTLTGSIGVFVLRPVVAELLEREAVHTTVIQRGANSGLMGGTQPSTESEREAVRAQVFTLYDDFKQRVRDGRGISEEQLEPIAGGRVWLGQEAIELGLVDQLGGIPVALLKAQALAGLTEDRNAPLLMLRGGREQLPPQQFPAEPAAMMRLLVDALRPRAWALLPFDIV